MKPSTPCPECGASAAHHPFGDILILRCRCCGFAIGADDLHDVAQNWDRRARTITERMGSDIHWQPGMTKAQRMDLIGCRKPIFDRLLALPKESRS